MTNFTDSTYNEVITVRKQVDSLFKLVDALSGIINHQGNRLQKLETPTEECIELMDDVLDAAQEAMIDKDYHKLWRDIVEEHYPELKDITVRSEVQDD